MNHRRESEIGLAAYRMSAPEAFSTTRYKRFMWTRESIIRNSPEAPGVYGLYNALWIFIGVSNNIRARMLEDIADVNAPFTRFRPTGFAFEIIPGEERGGRHRQLIEELQPMAQTRSFRRPA